MVELRYYCIACGQYTGTDDDARDEAAAHCAGYNVYFACSRCDQEWATGDAAILCCDPIADEAHNA